METVIANRYTWGPAWYAPVWGVTYFFFNYHDPVDGRFVYRKAFREFLDLGGGTMGPGGIKKIEEIVLCRPAAPTKGVDFSKAAQPLKLPATVAELNAIWKEWILNLRDEQSGKLQIKQPYHEWARFAVQRKDRATSLEYFEKAMIEAPLDVELLLDFGGFLGKNLHNEDRASKLLRRAIQVLEAEDEVDEKRLAKAKRLLAKWDPKLRAINRIHSELSAAVKSLSKRYLDSDLPLMAMHISGRFGVEVGETGMLEYFEKGLQKGEAPWIWKLAYNERDLNGWMVQDDTNVFEGRGDVLLTSLGSSSDDEFLYQLLTLDVVTSGDFSLEAEVYADARKSKFCGVVMGKKGQQNCQTVVLFPGGEQSRSGFIDLATFYDDDSFDTHRHNPAKGDFPGWQTLRVDVSGKLLDVWFNGELVLTHEFPNLDLLRGGLGLIAGTGESKYRSVRYLSFAPRDPRARIARSIRMERHGRNRRIGSTRSGINGSWLKQVPPWFDHLQWIQKPRQSWEEQGPVPTLIAFWSIAQNEVTAIDDWLNHLAHDYSDVGLEVVSIVSANDKDRIARYLEDHRFPGSIAVDAFLRRGYGEAFDRFGIGTHFELPRIVLLDIDQGVIWEGDPGFKSSAGFAQGVESHLKGPLNDLIRRKNLCALHKWRQDWDAKGGVALHDGNLDVCAPLLLKALSFSKNQDARVAEARETLEHITLALDSLETTAQSLSRQEGEPALGTLLAWGKIVDWKADSKTMRSIRSTLKSPHSTEWSKIVAVVKRHAKSLKPGQEIAVSRKLLKKVGNCRGCFSLMLKADLVAAADAGDSVRIKAIFDSVELIPGRWLARKYFKW